MIQNADSFYISDLERLFQTTDKKVIRKDNNFYAVSKESLQPKFTILKDLQKMAQQDYLSIAVFKPPQSYKEEPVRQVLERAS